MCFIFPPSRLAAQAGWGRERQGRRGWGRVSCRHRNWVCQPVCHSCSSCMSSSCPLRPTSQLYCTHRRLVRSASGSPAVYTTAASRLAGRSNQRPVSRVATRASPRPSGGSRPELCSLDHARIRPDCRVAACRWWPSRSEQQPLELFLFLLLFFFFSKRSPRVPLRLAGSGRWGGRQKRGRASRAPSAARCRG